MRYRYNANFNSYGIGRAISNVVGWRHTTPRVGGLYDGLITPIPDINQPIHTLDYCIQQSAADIISLDRPIVVMWSGGLDSTIALVALAMAKHNHPIMYTINTQAFQSSSATLRDALNKLGVAPIQYSFDMISKLRDDGWLFVTGTHADSITLGELADASKIHDSIWDMDHIELLTNHNNAVSDGCPNRLKSMINDWENNLDPLFDLMPLEQTVVNRSWWLDFTCCWSRDEYDMVFKADLLGGLGKDYINFFGSNNFQRWAIQDVRDKAIGRDAKGRLRAWLDTTLNIDSKCVKNLMSSDYISPNYSGVLGNLSLVAIDENYRPIMVN